MPDKLPLPLRLPPPEGDLHASPQRNRSVEGRLLDLADALSRRIGMSRRAFLASASGMAAAFLALNAVHGPLFEVDPAEAADPDAAALRLVALRDQFVFDVQTHFVSNR